MYVVFKSQKLGQAQRNARGDDAFHGRIIGQVQEERCLAQRPTLYKRVLEEIGSVVGDAQGDKDDGKLSLSFGDLSLARNLGGQFVVRQTRSGKDGQLLPTYQRVHAVDGRHPSLDKVLGIDASHGIQRSTVDIHSIFGQGSGQTIPRTA